MGVLRTPGGKLRLPTMIAAGLFSPAPGLADFTIVTSSTPEDFKVQIDGATDLVVDWGDGSAADTLNGNGLRTHAYATAGTHLVKVVSGTATRIAFGETGCTPLLLTAVASTISASIGLTSANDMFNGCDNCTSWAAGFFDDASANINDMNYMLYGCTTFNEVISWDTAKVTTMARMFYNCIVFNQSVASFDTAEVTNMAFMFYGCAVFNQSVANFDTAKVTTMYAMFYNCIVFNQSVASFDTAEVTNMAFMFYGCAVFNQSVANFDTAKVTTIVYMFNGCTAFDQDISGFDVTLLTDATDMLNGSGFTQTNYDLLLSLSAGWPSQVLNDSVAFHAGTAKYDDETPDIANGRAHLVDALPADHAWTVTDGGPD